MIKIGPSTAKNYLNILFALQLGTDFLHSRRMNWMTEVITIVLYRTKNDVTVCILWRLKIKVKDLRP